MTQPPSGRLHDLVQKLNTMGPAPSLVELAEAVQSAELTLADVAPYVQTNPRNYNRALVALREHYELLVMTWLPGQASVPHDHAGSICIMQVLQGDATEGSFCVAADGYVDPDYESTVRCREVTAGQDAGIHTVRNPSDANESLVTLHVYAPPLRDFRRFVLRPRSSDYERNTPNDMVPTIVVVGGGFSGSMTAAQTLRRASHAGMKVRVVVVERRGAVGEGLAYGTREIAHLLNVPAGRMTAWPDRPDDFVRWASSRYGSVRPDDFLPRQWYGEYVRESLLTTAHELGDTVELSVLFDEVRRVARRPEGGWLVHMAGGASLRAEAVVLAIGHRPPDDPIGWKWSGPRTRFISDPWRPFAMNVVRPEESVVVLGSGLTAVDTVLSLVHSSRQAPITIISRRGLLPQAHAHLPLTPVDMQPLVSELMNAPEGVRTRDICRKLRRTVRELASEGVDWRSVVDGLRPHTAALWQAMCPRERRRFLLHMRPFWEVHRHRMALAIAERFGELRKRNQVLVVAGRIMSCDSDGNLVRLKVCGRNSLDTMNIEADWVINCTGPAPSNCAASNPAIGSLLVDGWLRPDELRLGIETTIEGNAIDGCGREVRDLFLVGTLRKPAVWESTAVPELRNQAAVVADRVLRLLTQGARRMTSQSMQKCN